ncbi:MAG: hypothetical protein HY562_12370 [Ignavibacteriales bacterium]|nr:hypothetical protein [Ignavibacteriales bacterium]
MKNQAFLIILLVLSVSHPLRSQSIYLPGSHEVYPFLKRMEAKRLLADYRDAALPLSRKEIAKKLLLLEQFIDSMTTVERAEFSFLREEFYYELSSLGGDSQPSEIRWHLLSQPLTGGILNLDLDYTLNQRFTGPDKSSSRGQGLKLYGYAFEDVGFYFNWVDYRERGTGFNATKSHTPEPGVVLQKNIGDVIEYNNIDAQLTFNVGSFEFSVEKTKNIWGYGRNGRVILSDKPPSYPQLKMRVPLSDNIDFVYFHAELNSDDLDSLRSYYTFSSSLANFYRPVNRSKYMAAHQLEFSLWDGVDLSLGESVVYSDRGPLLLYLIPIMFFKAGELYNKDTDNTQVFGSLDLNVIQNVNMYFSLFIDEINTDDFFDVNKSRKQVGVTLGFQAYDILLDDFEFAAEYSRVNPWVYSHRFTAANFTNNSYDLGHWIGQNADNLRFELGYSLSRALKLNAFSEVYRKGDREDVAFQYQAIAFEFLYGPAYHEERTFGLSARYQPVRDLFVDFKLRRWSVSDNMFPSLTRDKQLDVSIGASLGVW